MLQKTWLEQMLGSSAVAIGMAIRVAFYALGNQCINTRLETAWRLGMSYGQLRIFTEVGLLAPCMHLLWHCWILGIFVKAPSEELLDSCTKEQLLKIVERYEIQISDKQLKDTVKSILKAKWVK